VLVRRIARPLLGSIFLIGGLEAARRPAGKVPAAEKVKASQMASTLGLSSPEQLVRLNGTAQALGAAALIMNRVPRLAAFGLAASLVPTTLAGHRFWEQEDPTTRAAQRIQFAKNLSVLGGLLLAVVDTGGKESVARKVRRRSKDVVDSHS
jgi:uncharacterized membrane protein YphA (DoxX/SURF4 family)